VGGLAPFRATRGPKPPPPPPRRAPPGTAALPKLFMGSLAAALVVAPVVSTHLNRSGARERDRALRRLYLLLGAIQLGAPAPVGKGGAAEPGCGAQQAESLAAARGPEGQRAP
jgi:hypothetical protein